MERIRAALERHPPRRILLLRLSALGDVLHCLPALAALRGLYPAAAIDWVTESLSAGLLEGHPDLDRVVRFPRKEITRGLRRPSEGVEAFDRGESFLRTLRSEEYDLVVDLQGNLRSAAVTRLTRARCRVGHHPRETRETPWLAGAARPRSPAGAVHRVEKNVHLIRALGHTGPIPDGRLPRYAEEEARLRDALGSKPPPTLLHPFVSVFGRFKEWPPERFAELARALDRRGHRVLITSAPDDHARRERIIDASGAAARPAPPTRSPRELAALIRLSRGLIAADTGPLHLAAFAGVPVVGLFGPKDPSTYGPWSAHSEVCRGVVPCAPCRLRRCEHSICMQSIGVDAVLAAVASCFTAPSPAPAGST